MARSREKSATGKIFDNILFLAEVFGDKSSGEIPNVPVLELACCFELKNADPKQVSRRRRKPPASRSRTVPARRVWPS
jgi:hypothetical protein